MERRQEQYITGEKKKKRAREWQMTKPINAGVVFVLSAPRKEK